MYKSKKPPPLREGPNNGSLCWKIERVRAKKLQSKIKKQRHFFLSNAGF